MHALVTTTPLPRTAFTLGAGLMFGPWLGAARCAWWPARCPRPLGFAVARRLGGRAIRRLGAGRVRMLEAPPVVARPADRCTSTRLVPAIPFAPLNYTFGVTSVRWRPYLVGTAVGLVPGTAAVVLLGDAATGTLSPAMIAVFVVSGAIGSSASCSCARGPRPRARRSGPRLPGRQQPGGGRTAPVGCGSRSLVARALGGHRALGRARLLRRRAGGAPARG